MPKPWKGGGRSATIKQTRHPKWEEAPGGSASNKYGVNMGSIKMQKEDLNEIGIYIDHHRPNTGWFYGFTILWGLYFGPWSHMVTKAFLLPVSMKAE